MIAEFMACPVWVRVLALLGLVLASALVGPFFLPRMWRRPR